MTIRNKAADTTIQTNNDVKMDRHQSAEYINSTYGTMSVWAASNDRHDLKPFKENGRVYYWKSSLDRYLDRQLTHNAA